MRLTVYCLVVFLFLAPGALSANQSGAGMSENFDAAAAWIEFETVLREKYAYLERDDIDVESQFVRSRNVAEQAQDQREIRRIFHQTALTFMDPHLLVGPLEDSDYAVIMTAADMSARFEGDVALIEDVRRGSPAFDAGLRPDDRIVSIDGIPAGEAARLPFGEVLPEPSEAQLDYGLTLAVNGKRASDRILEVAKGESRPRTVTIGSTRGYARSLRDRAPVRVEFVGPNKDVAQITPLNSLGNNATIESFDDAMVEAKDARAVILDMRETPSGGNTEVARSIIGHFIGEPMPYQMHRIPAFEREFTVPRQFVEYVVPREPYYGGPVYVLHGKWTGSMGEGIVIGMDAATDATTIGSDMGDLLGGLWNWTLEKSGAQLDFGGEALFHVDGNPREDFVARFPIMPANTAPDGSDPALDLVLAIVERMNDANPSR